MSLAKNYRPASLFSFVSKIFEELADNKIFGQLKKCGLLFDFQYGFRSCLTADLIAFKSDRISLSF